MEAKLRLQRGTGLPIGNALRQIAMSKLPAWRPVAFALDREFNLIHATANIVEDTYKIMSNINSLRYIRKGQQSGDFIKETIKFKRVLKTSNIESTHFNVEGEDIPLISCLDDDTIELTIIYRYSSGMLEIDNNLQFLIENGEIPEKYYVMSSRHTNITNFKFSISEESTVEYLNISLESDIGNEKDLLMNTIKYLKSVVDNIDSQLG